MKDRARLVYGVLGDTLVLLPEDVAKVYADDHSAIRQLKTFGDARRFQPCGINRPPGLDEDDYDVVPRRSSDTDHGQPAITVGLLQIWSFAIVRSASAKPASLMLTFQANVGEQSSSLESSSSSSSLSTSSISR
jgi:hypothetical protein